MNETKNSQFNPNYAVPPGAVLQEWLEEHGMSQTEIAERMSRPIKTVNEIIKGKTTITQETALQLEAVTGTPASFWNNADRIYQERSARLEQQERFKSWESWARLFPFKDMLRLGWVAPVPNAPVPALLRYFGVASPKAWNSHYGHVQVSYRQSQAFTSDLAHLAAWLRRGELQAQETRCAEFNKNTFRAALCDVKALTRSPIAEACPKVATLCSNAGVAVAFVPELPRTRVCGATRWLSPTKAIIQLSLRYKTDDQLWFTFFHEAAHILLHSKKSIFLESDDQTTPEETEANTWAADFLIPPDQLAAFLRTESLTRAAISRFAQQLAIAPGIVAGRLQHDDHLTFARCGDLKRRIGWHEGLPIEKPAAS